ARPVVARAGARDALRRCRAARGARGRDALALLRGDSLGLRVSRAGAPLAAVGGLQRRGLAARGAARRARAGGGARGPRGSRAPRRPARLGAGRARGRAARLGARGRALFAGERPRRLTLLPARSRRVDTSGLPSWWRMVVRELCAGALALSL